MNSHQRRKERRAHERFRRSMDRVAESDLAIRWAIHSCKMEAREVAHQAEMRRRRAELGVEG